MAHESPPPQPSVPAGLAPRGLMMSVTVALAVTGGVLAGILLLADARDWWSGLGAATIASVLSAALSLPVLLAGLRRGVDAAVACYFMAAGVRLVVSLGGCLLAVHVGHYPLQPTLLLMVPYYLAVLAVEAVFVGRFLWNARI